MSLRTAYQDKLQAQLEEQMARLNLLKAKAKHAAADGRIMAYEELATAEEKLAQMKTNLKKVAGSSEEALKEMKTGLEKAFGELKQACQKAAARFETKEANGAAAPETAPKTEGLNADE